MPKPSTSVTRAGHSNLLIGGIASLSIVALLLTFLVFGKEIRDNHAAIDRTNRVVHQLKVERAVRRAQIAGQIRDLACFLVSQTPDNPRKPIIHEFRARYHCPPYSKRNARRELQRHLSPQPTRSPAPSGARPGKAPGPSPAPTVTATTTTSTVSPSCVIRVGRICVTFAPIP